MKFQSSHNKFQDAKPAWKKSGFCSVREFSSNNELKQVQLSHRSRKITAYNGSAAGFLDPDLVLTLCPQNL